MHKAQVLTLIGSFLMLFACTIDVRQAVSGIQPRFVRKSYSLSARNNIEISIQCSGAADNRCPASVGPFLDPGKHTLQYKLKLVPRFDKNAAQILDAFFFPIKENPNGPTTYDIYLLINDIEYDKAVIDLTVTERLSVPEKLVGNSGGIKVEMSGWGGVLKEANQYVLDGDLLIRNDTSQNLPVSRYNDAWIFTKPDGELRNGGEFRYTVPEVLPKTFIKVSLIPVTWDKTEKVSLRLGALPEPIQMEVILKEVNSQFDVKIQ